MAHKRVIQNLLVIVILFATLFPILPGKQAAQAAIPAGYSEYYIPGSEVQMWGIFYNLDPYGLNINDGMHSIVAVTTGVNNTVLYYDQWEDGYDFDINDPASADETYYTDAGDVQIFESSHIPVNPRGSATYYDGRDRIYAVGGAVTVSRSTWSESAGTLFAQAWEVLPTKPYLTQYRIPAGENLAVAPFNYTDFTKAYVIVQSTADDNSIQINDPLTAPSPDLDVTLNKGEVTELYHINAGTTVNAAYPVQVQTIYGNNYGGNAHYDSRDFTLVPSTLWDTEYYSPVGGFSGGAETDLYVHNPYTTTLTIRYEDSVGMGSFDVPAGGTLAYSTGTGRTVPLNSGVYLNADQPFWAIGSADTESTNFDWGFSLVPASALTNEYYLGWAPGTSEPVPTENGSPAFVAPVADDTTIYADFSPTDGIADVTYTIDRLQTQKIFDPDNDNTGMHIWSSGPVAVAWGEDPDTAGTAAPYLDMGFTTLPMVQTWIDPMLSIDKFANPDIVSNEAGQSSTFTLLVSSYEHPVNDVNIFDDLPDGWAYTFGSTTITLPDGSQLNGAAADPSINGQTLAWNLNLDMDRNQTMMVMFSAETISTIPGLYSRNRARAVSVQGNHTFTATDDALIRLSDLSINKTSSANGSELSPGDVVTYTVVITNHGALPEHGFTINDPVPAGTTYISGSSQVHAPAWQSHGTYLDHFNALNYSGNDGTLNWATNWLEINESDGARAGDEQVLSILGSNRLRVQAHNGGGEGVQREANLTGGTIARLTFDYRRNNLDDANDYVTISASNNGGTSWTELGRYAGPDNDAGFVAASYDLTPFRAANSRIRFLSSANLGNSDRVYFDNVQIELLDRVMVNSPGGAPPALVSPSDGYELLPGESMSIFYQVRVDDSLPDGQDTIVNTVTVSSLSTPERFLQDSVTDPVDNPTALVLTSFSASSTAMEGLGYWLALLSLAALACFAVFFGLRRQPVQT